MSDHNTTTTAPAQTAARPEVHPALDPDDLLEIEPGKFARATELTPLPKVAQLDWVRAGGGQWRPKLRYLGRNVRLSQQNVDALNLGVPSRTILRLVRAGFVDGYKVAPQTWVFSLESYLAHVEAVEDDPDFWEPDNPDNNLARYRKALLGGAPDYDYTAEKTR